MRLKADVAIFDIIGHLVLWLLLCIVTFGIAMFFFPYSFSKFIINRTYLVDEHGVERKMRCDIDLFSDLGHVLLWFIISILTLGIGYIFYFYRVWNYALNHTQVD
ncbi:hypothetical protein BCU70_06150 [Vibrio sp. 10N.286.49.C2]|uniref:DUF6693 family protein n=1 Tax=unclassified Vibrio TaxID=2614977 RepID=UPI000C81DFAE|nr:MULTISPECIES: DUF6693 family protein [unclassified Vibrio]PMH31477.1 hypothetical protein BCU70_06150 [Vibrio sp. 10N.286.49.C2]PMH50498.1 hypothetical protein BCU66_18510 [Vibrio sp. 10N.286.49.B1]PMH78020.1 hypothetical protein BCU58_10805 [Vibrio sp. 10N.286.48.B7]